MIGEPPLPPLDVDVVVTVPPVAVILPSSKYFIITIPEPPEPPVSDDAEEVALPPLPVFTAPATPVPLAPPMKLPPPPEPPAPPEEPNPPPPPARITAVPVIDEDVPSPPLPAMLPEPAPPIEDEPPPPPPEIFGYPPATPTP